MKSRPKVSEQKAMLAVMTAKIIMLLNEFPDGIDRLELDRFKPSSNHTHILKQCISDLAAGAIITRIGSTIKLNDYMSAEIEQLAISISESAEVAK